jgi:hypothetical protein
MGCWISFCTVQIFSCIRAARLNGLGLWNLWAASIAMEVLFFGTGLGIYLSGTRARANTGRYGFWALIAFLFFGWVSSLLAGARPT